MYNDLPESEYLDYYTYGNSPQGMAEGGSPEQMMPADAMGPPQSNTLQEIDIGGLTQDLPPDTADKLIQMIMESGAPEEEIAELIAMIQELAQTPGGLELLMQETTDGILNAQGFKRGGRVQQVRLYYAGGSVGFEEGGLAAAADAVREGGQDEDEILLHMTPDEFEALQAMWGPATINPVTGLPEYGFLKRAFKKVKKFVKRLVKNPIFQAVAPILLNFVIPGLGVAIGAALGATGAAASVVGSAVIGAGFGAASGQGIKGTLAGAIGGAGAGGAGGMLGKGVGLSGQAANIAGNAAISAGAAGISGGDPLQAGLMGGLATYAIPKGMDALGVKPSEFGMPEQTGVTPDGMSAAPVMDTTTMGPPESLAAMNQVGPPSPGALSQASTGSVGGGGVTDIPTVGASGVSNPNAFGLPGVGTPAATTTAPKTWTQRIGTTLSDNALPLAGLAAASGAFSGPKEHAEDPNAWVDTQVGPEYSRPLQQTDYTGTQHAAIDPYSYGQMGGEQTLYTHNFATPESAATAMNSTPDELTSQGYAYSNGQWAKAAAQGGLMQSRRPMMQGGGDPRILGEVSGAGTGRSDEIPAALSDGEYVMDAEIVSLIGDGSNDAGADRLDEMRENLRKHKGAALAQGKISPDARNPMDYLPQERQQRAKGGKIKNAADEFSSFLEEMEAVLEQLADRKIEESGVDTTTRDPTGSDWRAMEEAYEPSMLTSRMRDAIEENDLKSASDLWYDLVEKYPDALSEAQESLSVYEMDRLDLEMAAAARGDESLSPSPGSSRVTEPEIRGKYSNEFLGPDDYILHAKGGKIERALKFITDMGDSLKIQGDTDRLGFDSLKRYGVWEEDPIRGKPQVIETSDDLAKLLEKHGLTEKDVQKLASGGRARMKLAKGGRVTPRSRIDSIVEAMFERRTS